MRALTRIGVSLWTMQSTAARPGLARALYRRFAEDAQLAEQLGFHAVWVGEHRVWYDGWCPAPLHALAAVAARTTRIGLGTAVYLLPQHEPVAAARSIATLDHLSGGRVELGPGLGYRDPEFDALGLRRDHRGQLMDAALDTMEAVWAGEHGDEPPVRRAAPRIWLGGMAPRAIARAAARGYGLMLPQTLRPEEYRRTVDAYHSRAARPGMVGALREVWVTDSPDGATRHAERIRNRVAEEAGSWWAFRDGYGFAARASVERQVARSLSQLTAGTPERVAEALRGVLAAGVEYLALRPAFDFVEQGELHEQLHRLGEEVAPLLAGASRP